MYYYDSRKCNYSLEYQDRKNAMIAESARKMEDKKNSIMESREMAIQLDRKYNTFKEDVKRSLVVESIYHIMKPTLESVDHQEYAKLLVNNFVVEEDANKLIREFAEKTQLLSEMSNIITNTYEQVLESVDKTDANTFIIKPSITKDFFDKLDGCNITKVVDQINKKVCKATEDFVQNNINDKLDMEELAQKTKDKIDSTRNLDKTTEEQIKQEHANMYRRQLDDITKKRSRNVYEEMVSVSTKTILKDNTLMESFVTESGSLNVDAIIEKTDIMYRLLETVNTARIKDVDQTYIQKVIKSIS